MHTSKFSYAYEKRIQRIQIRSDSRWCVDALNHVFEPRRHEEIFDEIKFFYNRMQRVEYVHLPRASEEGNREADFLGKPLLSYFNKIVI